MNLGFTTQLLGSAAGGITQTLQDQHNQQQHAEDQKMQLYTQILSNPNLSGAQFDQVMGQINDMLPSKDMKQWWQKQAPILKVLHGMGSMLGISKQPQANPVAGAATAAGAGPVSPPAPGAFGQPTIQPSVQPRYSPGLIATPPFLPPAAGGGAGGAGLGGLVNQFNTGPDPAGLFQ